MKKIEKNPLDTVFGLVIIQTIVFPLGYRRAGFLFLPEIANSREQAEMVRMKDEES